MSFFADLPEPDAPEHRYVEPEWRRVPVEVVPGRLGITQLVHRSDEFALVLAGADVFPRGVAFDLLGVKHPGAEPGGEAMHEALHGGPRGRGEVLRVGVLFDDGRRAAYPDDMFMRGDAGPRAAPPDVAISSRGGSGSNGAASISFYVWPLPERGDLTLVFRWVAGGLDEARVVIDGDELRAAAAQAQDIWPGSASQAG